MGHSKLRLFNDVRLHGTEDTEKCVLVSFRDLELVESSDEILDESIEISRADAHARVRGLHVLAGVLAGSAGSLANLVDQVALELLQARRISNIGFEEGADAGIAGTAANEVIHHCGDAFLLPQAVIQRLAGRSSENTAGYDEQDQGRRKDSGDAILHIHYLHDFEQVVRRTACLARTVGQTAAHDRWIAKHHTPI